MHSKFTHFKLECDEIYQQSVLEEQRQSDRTASLNTRANMDKPTLATPTRALTMPRATAVNKQIIRQKTGSFNKKQISELTEVNIADKHYGTNASPTH